MFHNQWDVQEIVSDVIRHNPQYQPYAMYALDWLRIVNNNSDGWAHWSPGPNAAEKLLNLLERVRRGGDVEEAALRRALAPIKTIATKKKLPAPVFGGGIKVTVGCYTRPPEHALTITVPGGNEDAARRIALAQAQRLFEQQGIAASHLVVDHVDTGV